MAIALSANAQMVTVSASHTTDANGNNLTGTIYFQPTDANGNPISVRLIGSGQVTQSKVSTSVTNGAFSISLVDTTQAQPANFCYAVLAYDQTNRVVLGGRTAGELGEYTCVQVSPSWCSGTVCSFDSYQPGISGLTPVTLPLPTSTTPGGVKTIACGGGNSVNSIDGTGAAHCAANGGSSAIVGSAETVTFSGTPTFSNSTRASIITLTANITTFTLAAGVDGQEKTLTFCQNATGYSVLPPASVHGFFSVGLQANKCSSQHFTYYGSQSAWLADSTGILNQ